GENQYFAPAGTATSFSDSGATGTAGSPVVTSAANQTVTISAGATASALAAAVGGLTLINGAGNLDVQKAGGVYRIRFLNQLAGESVAAAETSAVTPEGGTVVLHWTGITGATGYRVYRGDQPRSENAWFAVGATTTFSDSGAPGTAGTPRTTSAVVATSTTAALAYNATAAAVQSALEGLAGTGNVVVALNDDIYVIRFQGTLSGSPVLPLVVHPSLTLAVEQLGGAVTPGTASAVMTTRSGGYASPETNQVQVLTVDATGGSYVL